MKQITAAESRIVSGGFARNELQDFLNEWARELARRNYPQPDTPSWE